MSATPARRAEEHFHGRTRDALRIFGHNPFTGQPRPFITPQTQGPDPLSVVGATNGEQGLKTYGGVLDVRYQLPGFDFISTSAYRHETNYSTEDLGRTPEVAAY